MRERSEEKAENKKRPDVDKYHVTVLRRSFVCVKISYLGSLSFSLSLKEEKEKTLSKNSILWERKRVAQQIEISSFSSIWWRSKLLHWCCKNTHFFVCWIIIVIIFFRCFGLKWWESGTLNFPRCGFFVEWFNPCGVLEERADKRMWVWGKTYFYFLSKLIYGFILLDDFVNWVLLYFNYVLYSAFWNC